MAVILFDSRQRLTLDSCSVSIKWIVFRRRGRRKTTPPSIVKFFDIEFILIVQFAFTILFALCFIHFELWWTDFHSCWIRTKQFSVQFNFSLINPNERDFPITKCESGTRDTNKNKKTISEEDSVSWFPKGKSPLRIQLLSFREMPIQWKNLHDLVFMKIKKNDFSAINFWWSVSENGAPFRRFLWNSSKNETVILIGPSYIAWNTYFSFIKVYSSARPMPGTFAFCIWCSQLIIDTGKTEKPQLQAHSVCVRLCVLLQIWIKHFMSHLLAGKNIARVVVAVYSLLDLLLFLFCMQKIKIKIKYIYIFFSPHHLYIRFGSRCAFSYAIQAHMYRPTRWCVCVCELHFRAGSTQRTRFSVHRARHI